MRQDGLELKFKAMQLNQLKSVDVSEVADTLEIHPFILSRWRKEARPAIARR
jgi:transposase